MQNDVVSKTKQKRAMLELQALGVELVDLPNAQLATMMLPESLAAAIVDAELHC